MEKTRLEMDILKEVGGTAAAHGSTALSEMLCRKISLSVPDAKIIPVDRLSQVLAIDGPTITLQTKILEGLKGESLFIVFDEKSAYRLVDICYKTDEPMKKGSIYTEMSMSLMKEIGNVVTAAYMGAIGYFLKKLIIPSLPVLINASFEEIIRLAAPIYDNKGSVLLVESVFEEPKAHITGNFWLILTPGAADEIMASCKKLLHNIQ